jgi:hypothetical protein
VQNQIQTFQNPMKIIIVSSLLLLFSANSISAKAQPSLQNEHLLTQQWDASWISVPDIDGQAYGVYEFCKGFELAEVPSHYIVHVSGDNRYKLFVNDKLMSVGPARSDMLHWNYETIDLAATLHTGINEVKAIVWNEGADRAEANMSVQTAFLMQGDDEASSLNTDTTWLCRVDHRYSPHQFELMQLTYMVTGPGENVDLNVEPALWRQAAIVAPVLPHDAVGGLMGVGMTTPWMLQPSLLEQRELKEEHTLGFKSLTIPARSSRTILLDNGVLTNAYLTMNFSQGKDARITLSYQEGLFSEYPCKGNRNETQGKRMIGREDVIIGNGQSHQSYTTLGWRTYRYVQLSIETADQPLTIHDVYGTFTGYPFEMKARLETDNQELQDMLTIGWRTARLCAWETYTDCPYYEQLQYLGDTRIQMLITLMNVGDDAFIRNYLNLADQSRNVEGVTQSRYPAKTPQYITPYALHYIYSLHDYMMYADQLPFIADKLTGMRSILHYFHHFQTEDGRLRNLPGWNFTDWVYDEPAWRGGICLPGKDGGSCVMDLQLLYAYQVAADLERQLGLKEQAHIYETQAAQLASSIEEHYWDADRGLYSDHTEHDTYSQHANAMAIVTRLAQGERAQQIARRLESDSSLAPASIYFKFYVHQAMTMAGLGDNYLNWLDKWRENMSMGLTTWAETSDVDNSRSDCHAWGASPNIEFFRTILGIDSHAPAFAEVRIEPHLGDIQEIGGEIPHPKGSIQVDYKRDKHSLHAVITLPDTVTGIFVWQGRETTLHAGKNIVTL